MKIEKIKTTRFFAPLIFLVVFSFGLIWAAIVPADNEAPDEASHLNMIYFLKNHQRAPIFDHEPDLIPTQYDLATMSQVYYSMAYISPVSYLPYIYSLKAQNEDISKGNVLPARIISTLLLALAAIFTYYFFASVGPKNQPVAAAATLFIFLIPQVIFSAGYINVEPFALLLSALSLFFLGKIMANYQKWQNYVYFGLSLGFLGLAKPNYYILIFFILLSILFYLKFQPKRQAVKYFYISGAIFILINLYWWIRNIILFGDPLIFSYIKKNIISRAPEGISSLSDQGYNLLTIFGKNDFIKFSAGGFFANLGGANIFFPLIFYLIFFTIILFFIIFAFKNQQKSKPFIWPFALTVLAAIIYFAYKNLSDYSPQGRHLLPLMIPLGLILYLSLSSIKLLWQRILGVLPVVFVFFSSLYGLWLTINRYFVTGLAYVNKSNFGKIVPDFSWREFSVTNYEKLFNYIFNGNPPALGQTAVAISFVVLLLSLIIIFYLIIKTKPQTSAVD